MQRTKIISSAYQNSINVYILQVVNMKKTAFLFLVLFFIAANTFADENHYINFFIGDRAAGLGGAYTAIADGPEGVFYNPAGLAFSSSKYFSLSVNAFQYKMLYYHDVYKKTDGEPFDYVRHSFSFIPNFFGFVQKAKNFTFALTISSPDSEFYDQRDNTKIKLGEDEARLNVNYNLTEMTYDVGPSFAFLINKYVSVGFNIFLKIRDKKMISQTTYLIDEVDYKMFFSSSIYNNQTLFGLKQQFGLQIMPVKQLSIGYSISASTDFININTTQRTHSERQRLLNEGSWNTIENFEVQDNKVTILNIAENLLFQPLFINQTLGLAWFINKSALLSFDASLYIPIQMYHNGDLVFYEYNKERKDYDIYGLDETQKLNIVGNFALGLEYYLTPNFPLRIGAFTNFTNTPEIKEKNGFETRGYKDMKDHVHLFGGSISLGFATTDLTVNVGASVSGGSGKAQILGGSTAVQDLNALTVNLFLSGGYQF